MNSSETSNATPAAMITEKELWALFAGYTMKTTYSMGPTVKTYRPDELLREPGEWGDMEDFANMLADDLTKSDAPERDLEIWICEIRGYLRNLEMISGDFSRLKASLVVYPEDDDDDEEVRYQVPTVRASVDTNRAQLQETLRQAVDFARESATAARA